MLPHYWYHEINPSRPDPGRGEKINLNFYFHTFLWFVKRSNEDLTFKAPQRTVKIKI